MCKTIRGVTFALSCLGRRWGDALLLGDTPWKTSVLWPHQPAAGAVGIGPFGIECLGAGVNVQFKKMFRHILICIFGLFGFLSWLFLI